MMARRLLDYIVLEDVEATCWDGEPPPGEDSDIIEIGVCLLHEAPSNGAQSYELPSKMR